jgi:hypothetical protein
VQKEPAVVFVVGALAAVGGACVGTSAGVTVGGAGGTAVGGTAAGGTVVGTAVGAGVGLAQAASTSKTINMSHIDFRNMLLLLSEKFG